ncbi:GTPase HflX, partial [Sulfolobus sp. F1]
LIIETLTSSFQILREIGVSGKPIIVVLNKIDKLDGDLDQKIELVKNKANELYSPIYDTIPVSALKRVNIDLLRDRVYQLITELT